MKEKQWTVLRAEPMKETKMEKPNLWGVITSDDVSQKGTGNFKADYMNWCLTMHQIHEHAPGWDFELVEWEDGSGHPQSVYKAPDGSAYVVGRWYLLGTDFKTKKFYQSCMDHRNNPIPYERVNSRILTDTERRCRCTSAASVFGLAGELWARVPVEDPHVEDNAQQGGNPFREEKPSKPKNAKKPSKSKAELTTEYAAGLGVTVDMVLAWSGLESIQAVIDHPEKSGEFKELLQKCKAGANAQELFSVEASTEFNFGEFGDEE